LSATALLEADCVSKHYGDRTVLNTASLRARAGMITALLGRNGAGKSTLLRCTVGEIDADQGNIRLDGATVVRPRLAWLARRGVCFVPDRDLLHPAVPVGSQCAWVARDCGTAAGVDTLLEQFGIAHVRDARPRSLSGGERRRAEVALALLLAPRVLVLDEPLRGIAPLDAEVILAALRRFAEQGGAVLLTGHELPLFMASVDAVTWCHAGRTREFTSVSAAMHDFAFRRDFLPSR
jgi:lipopolysaccharide export system ATP-binding protein